MSGRLGRYEDNLELLPEQERKAARQALHVNNGEPENVALSIIKQISRSKETLKRVR